MKQRGYAKYWILVIALWGNSTVFAEPFAKGPYLGQTPPGSTAQVFAPGLICHAGPHWWESHGHFSADGNTFCFHQVGYVMITENTDQGWTKPIRIESIPRKTTVCCVSPDANRIYFNYSEDPSSPYNRYTRFYSERTAQKWSLPQKVLAPGIRTGSPFSIAANNNFYFVHGSFGPHKKSGIFCAPFVDNTWPQAIIQSVHVQGKGVGHPGIAPDESFMVVNTIHPGGQGAQDLYITVRRPDGSWPAARNMGPRVNSVYFDWGARISPDKKYMFFTRSNGWAENSNRDTADIYWVELREYLPESYR